MILEPKDMSDEEIYREVATLDRDMRQLGQWSTTMDKLESRYNSLCAERDRRAAPIRTGRLP